MSMRLIVGAITILVLALPAYAIRLKGKLPSGVSSATALSVLSGDETQTTSIDEDSNSKFSLEVGGVDARLVLSQSNTTLPVLIAIQTNNGKIISVKKAKKQGICGESGTVGLTAFKKSISGRKSLRLKVEEISGTPAWVSVNNIKGFRGKAKFNKRGAKRVASKTHAAEINSDCSLKGNASNFGLSATVSGASVGTRLSEQDGDTDGDGNPNQTDIDHDDDGVLNNYDSNFTASSDSFRIFTNLKTGLENTLNSNIATVSDSEKTALLQSTQSMAIEVKAQTGETAELFCGPSSSGLEYCRPGGTGVISGSTTAFPDDVNSDGDDGGTITAGDTGDFQLLTKVTSKDNIGSGDSLTQVVTDADGNETRYLTNLQFAFTEIPALQSLVLDPDGTATSLFTESSYPVASSGSGTMNNPFSVTANTDGNIILRIVSYRPGREGISGAGEADVMQIGNSKITIDIPNGPSSGGSPSQGPGNCQISAYSESDTDLSTDGDTLRDAQADFDGDTETDGDGNKTVTFDIDITNCLAEVSETLDSGESLKVDLQFRNDAGDNAAQAFYIAVP